MHVPEAPMEPVVLDNGEHADTFARVALADVTNTDAAPEQPPPNVLLHAALKVHEDQIGVQTQSRNPRAQDHRLEESQVQLFMQASCRRFLCAGH